MESQLDLGLLTPSVEVAQLRQLLATRDREVEHLTRKLEIYELKLLAIARVGGSA